MLTILQQFTDLSTWKNTRKLINLSLFNIVSKIIMEANKDDQGHHY